ncbi:MAG: hypothetical protein Q4F66_09530 [Clostridium sp.]|nr:hypothetical protein [Clostridium sp.]
MKKNIKFLFVSVFLVAASMANAVSTPAAIYTGNNSLQSMAASPEERPEKKPENNTDKSSEENKDVAKPVSANQLSVNVVEITFNIPVEEKDATKASNYWVRSTEEDKPSGVATVGKNEKLSTSNSLTDDMVKIEPSTESGRVYKMTFKNNIKSGAEHKIHIYFVAPKGAEIYKGENGAIIFKAK